MARPASPTSSTIRPSPPQPVVLDNADQALRRTRQHRQTARARTTGHRNPSKRREPKQPCDPRHGLDRDLGRISQRVQTSNPHSASPSTAEHGALIHPAQRLVQRLGQPAQFRLRNAPFARWISPSEPRNCTIRCETSAQFTSQRGHLGPVEPSRLDVLFAQRRDRSAHRRPRCCPPPARSSAGWHAADSPLSARNSIPSNDSARSWSVNPNTAPSRRVTAQHRHSVVTPVLRCASKLHRQHQTRTSTIGTLGTSPA